LALAGHGQPGGLKLLPQILKNLDDRLDLTDGFGRQGRVGVWRGGDRLTQRILVAQHEVGTTLGQLLQREPRRTAAAVLGQADELVQQAHVHQPPLGGEPPEGLLCYGVLGVAEMGVEHAVQLACVGTDELRRGVNAQEPAEAAGRHHAGGLPVAGAGEYRTGHAAGRRRVPGQDNQGEVRGGRRAGRGAAPREGRPPGR
jgi:hypothetical protein